MKRKAKDNRAILYYQNSGESLAESSDAQKAIANHWKSKEKRINKRRKRKANRRYFASGDYVNVNRERQVTKLPAKTKWDIAGFSFNSDICGTRFPSMKAAITEVRRRFLQYCRNREIENRFDFSAEKVDGIIYIKIAEKPRDPDSGIFSGWVYKPV